MATNGISQPFDKNSSGYVRAEACCVIYLQKAENAKRIYATVVGSKTNNDGLKREGMKEITTEEEEMLKLCL